MVGRNPSSLRRTRSTLTSAARTATSRDHASLLGLMSTRLLAIPLALFLSAFGFDSAAAEPTAEEIYGHHVVAIGGQARLDAITSLVAWGTYREGEHSMAGVQAKMRPFYKLVGDPDKPSTEFREGYDGSAWEFYGDPGIVLRTVGPAAAAARHGSHIHGQLIDYQAQGSTLTLIGKAPIAGRNAFQLRIRMIDGFEQDEFIDARTWLRIGSRKLAKVHAFGADVASETRFSDYRRVNGVLMPFLDEEVEIATGKVMSTFKTTKIVVNRKIDLGAFSPPDFKRTPAGALIESLFAQRDDPQSVLWTYHDSRLAHPETNTDTTAQVAGYQILKMGNVATSIALLKENARNYPNSSGAAFGLGRAYRTAGNSEAARLEFTRALALDAGNKRAKAALDEMAGASR